MALMGLLSLSLVLMCWGFLTRMNPSGVSLSSESRYLSLRLDGTLSLASGSSSVITHNYGSVALVRVFYQRGGRWYSSRADASPWAEYSSGTNSVTISCVADGTTGTLPIYYRIYVIEDNLVVNDTTRLDKIYRKESFTGAVGASGTSFTPVTATTTIPHGQGEEALWTLQFSLDNTNWYPEGTRIFGSFDTGSGPPGGPYSRYYLVSAYGSSDASNFYITLVNNHPSAKTVYVRYALDLKT